MTKSFIVLLIFFLALGIGLGGAFAGGVAFGKTQSEAPSRAELSGLNFGQRVQGQSVQGPRGQLPGRSGRSNQQDKVSLQSTGQGHQSGSSMGLTGKSGRLGTVEKIEDNVVTVATPEGPVRATIMDDASIRKISDGTIEDLVSGARIMIFGPMGENDTIQARSIVITGDDAESLLGVQGNPGGDGLQRERRSP